VVTDVSDQRRRTLIRVLAIALQWVGVTTALGALAIRSDISFERFITPHWGAAPVFLGAFVGAFLLGLTLESPKALGALALLMCFVAASFVGIVLYAPVWDGTILRSNALDNFVSQRVLVLAMLMVMAALPGAAGGNLVGGWLDIRQEIMVDPRDLPDPNDEPWWEQRQPTAPE
jgi:hypothetical protein